MSVERGRSFYLFDIDDNLVFLPTKLHLWNAETREEKAVSSGAYAAIQSLLGRPGAWQAWSVRAETFRDFRDRDGVGIEQQPFLMDLSAVLTGTDGWRGPSWPLLVHAAANGRAIAMVTARGHAPATIEAGLRLLVERGHLAALPPILGIYTTSNPDVRRMLGADDPAMTTPSIKKLAIKHAVKTALERYGVAPPHRFGMSDDDANNVALAVSAMRDCKLEHPDKRFFVIDTNREEFVKLEIFPMAHPVTAAAEGRPVLADAPPPANGRTSLGGAASIYVTDIERAIGFYTSQLGLALRTRVGSEWAELDAGRGLILGLHAARPPETVAAGTRGAINIELSAAGPLDAAVAELKGRGVAFKGAIANYPAVRIATALDPDRNEILISQTLDAGMVDDAS